MEIFFFYFCYQDQLFIKLLVFFRLHIDVCFRVNRQNTGTQQCVHVPNGKKELGRKF